MYRFDVGFLLQHLFSFWRFVMVLDLSRWLSTQARQRKLNGYLPVRRETCLVPMLAARDVSSSVKQTWSETFVSLIQDRY